MKWAPHFAGLLAVCGLVLFAVSYLPGAAPEKAATPTAKSPAASKGPAAGKAAAKPVAAAGAVKIEPKSSGAADIAAASAASDITSFIEAYNLSTGVKAADWAQWGGTPLRNNVPPGKNIPSEWDTGGFDAKTGEWLKNKAQNIKWTTRLGSQSYGNPVVANGKVYVGTNNGAGYLKRYPAAVDLGCLLCFDQATGKFLWQHSSEKLSTGRVHDWPLQGICCAPLVEKDRLWFVTSRGEVLCLDTEGFHDGENDGPFAEEKFTEKDEADTVWRLDMMRELGVSQHNMCSCSVTCAGDLLFVHTANGVDEGHENLPAPSAPSFICLNKQTGKVIWNDNSPGVNVLHGQWSSPTYGIIKGVPQVIFGGGDGWLYSFQADEGKAGKPTLLWTFDCNPKESKYVLGPSATRNHIIGTPVIYEDKVFVGVGEDPEHLGGQGHLWCIDATKRGDVSAELAFNVKDLKTPLPRRRLQAVVKEDGDVARPNPNSAAVWHYVSFDANKNGKTEFEEMMHRTCGTVAIKNGLLLVADFSGLVHCLDAKTGKPHWTYDLLSASWSSPLIVDDKIYLGDEDGDMVVFALSAKQELIAETNMGSSVFTTPIVADNILYIADRDHLYAIEKKD